MKSRKGRGRKDKYNFILMLVDDVHNNVIVHYHHRCAHEAHDEHM